MRKIVTTLLCVALIASLLTGFAMAAAGIGNFARVNTYKAGMFTDVGTEWFAPNVKDAYELGLVKGKSTNSFAPGDNIKLSEVVALASRIHSIYNNGSANFTQGDPWYQVYYDYAVTNGIITPGQYVSYETNATRDNFVRILFNAMPKTEYTTKNNIAAGQIPDISEYENDQAYIFYRAGILTGKDAKGSFFPSANIQRSEVAAIVTRMAIPFQRQSFSLETTVGGVNLKENFYKAMEELNKAAQYLILAADAADYLLEHGNDANKLEELEDNLIEGAMSTAAAYDLLDEIYIATNGKSEYATARDCAGKARIYCYTAITALENELNTVDDIVAMFNSIATSIRNAFEWTQKGYISVS